MKRGKKVALFFVALLAGALTYTGIRFGPDLITLYRVGAFEREKKHDYQGDVEANLKALHTALMLYHDSEGQFPVGSGWMDAIANRLNTADLKEGEAAKKLRDPRTPEGQFGFALSAAASGKYKDDVPGKGDAILVFTCEDGAKNLALDPADVAAKPRNRAMLAVTVDGKIIRP